MLWRVCAINGIVISFPCSTRTVGSFVWIECILCRLNKTLIKRSFSVVCDSSKLYASMLNSLNIDQNCQEEPVS